MEIGIPFSDPVMDGPVIQQASQAALDAGATPPAILDAAAGLDVEIPLAVMTYYNIVHHDGHRRFAGRLVAAGVAGCIVPDLPLEEAEPWTRAADDAGVETIMLAAPTASDERLGRVVDRARGFVYSVGLLGVTGERAAARRHGDGAGRAAAADHRQAGARRRRGLQRRAGATGVHRGRRRGAGRIGRAPADGGRPRRRRRLRRRGARRDGLVTRTLVRSTDSHAPATTRYGGSISAAELVAVTATPPEPSPADDGERRAVGGLATRRTVPVAVIGLIGVVIAFVGITAMFAFQQAPFYDADEKAHLGYAHEIADFRLPEIERQPAVPDSATQWQVERSDRP